MGRKAEEALKFNSDELYTYLRANHAIYMQVESKLYYITDVNDHDWRVQDTDVLNEKGHYTDCSELIYILSEFMRLPFTEDGKSIDDLCDSATFYASVSSAE